MRRGELEKTHTDIVMHYTSGTYHLSDFANAIHLVGQKSRLCEISDRHVSNYCAFHKRQARRKHLLANNSIGGANKVFSDRHPRPTTTQAANWCNGRGAGTNRVEQDLRAGSTEDEGRICVERFVYVDVVEELSP